MPVVINEIEISEPSVPPSPAGPPAAQARAEPLHEQLRRLLRDDHARQRRLIAD